MDRPPEQEVAGTAGSQLQAKLAVKAASRPGTAVAVGGRAGRPRRRGRAPGSGPAGCASGAGCAGRRRRGAASCGRPAAWPPPAAAWPGAAPPAPPGLPPRGWPDAVLQLYQCVCSYSMCLHRASVKSYRAASAALPSTSAEVCCCQSARSSNTHPGTYFGWAARMWNSTAHSLH